MALPPGTYVVTISPDGEIDLGHGFRGRVVHKTSVDLAARVVARPWTSEELFRATQRQRELTETLVQASGRQRRLTIAILAALASYLSQRQSP